MVTENLDGFVHESHMDANEQQKATTCISTRVERITAVASMIVAFGVSTTSAEAKYNPASHAHDTTALGSHALATIIVGFEDQPAAHEPEEVRNFVYTAPDSAANIFYKESFGRFTFKSIYNPAGDVYGPVQVKNTLDQNCDNIKDVTGAAYAAAQQPGKNLGKYDDYLFLLPRMPRCPYGGISLGNVAVVNEPTRAKAVSVHELGHNLGLGHSNELHCGTRTGKDTIDTGACSKVEYNDPFDFMGGIRFKDELRHFNGFNKTKLGWGKTKTITKTTTFDIAPIDQPSNLVHSARVAIGGTKSYPEYVYLDYQQTPNAPLDDSGLSVIPVSGVAIRGAGELDRKGRKSSYPSTRLYDMNPGTSTLYDAPLVAGKSFRTKSGVRIKVVAADATHARVRVSGVDPSLVARDFYME